MWEKLFIRNARKPGDSNLNYRPKNITSTNVLLAEDILNTDILKPHQVPSCQELL